MKSFGEPSASGDRGFGCGDSGSRTAFVNTPGWSRRGAVVGSSAISFRIAGQGMGSSPAGACALDAGIHDTAVGTGIPQPKRLDTRRSLALRKLFMILMTSSLVPDRIDGLSDVMGLENHGNPVPRMLRHADSGNSE